MRKALLFAPMGSVHRRFNKANIVALQECGFEIHLLANFNDNVGAEQLNSDFATSCKKNNIKIHSFPFKRSSLFKNLKLLKYIRSLLRDYDYDIVHAHTETGGLLLRLVKDIKLKTKYIYTPHGMSFYKGSSLLSQIVYKPIEKWICNGMDSNLAMNMEEYKNLITWKPSSAQFVNGIGLDTSKIKNIDNNIGVSVRVEFNIPNDIPVFLSIGELNENKNHIIVLKAMAALSKEYNYRYIICGVGELKNKLEDFIKNNGLQEKVIFAGFRTDIPAIISASDCFIFPSFHEGLPVSMLEAMTGGLPLIASKIRGNMDLVTDNYNGFLFDPKDHHKLYQILKSFLDQPNIKSKIGVVNVSLANNYSFDVVKNQLKDIYRKSC